MTIEQERLQKNGDAWRKWGPYLSERAWGTVREDYSAGGNAWEYFPHDHARSRVYRWNEDGLGGISDDKGRMCFALALWNGRDPILKERLFGLTNSEGNHGEDVKEYYFYLDSTPTHSYMKMLYKYPQAPFPYARLVEENQKRDKMAQEFELIDTGVFAEERYFDVFVEYAKAAPNDILIRITAVNRGPEEAALHLLPTLWFRNTWSWNRDTRRGAMSAVSPSAVRSEHPILGTYHLYCERARVERTASGPLGQHEPVPAGAGNPQRDGMERSSAPSGAFRPATPSDQRLAEAGRTLAEVGRASVEAGAGFGRDERGVADAARGMSAGVTALGAVSSAKGAGSAPLAWGASPEAWNAPGSSANAHALRAASADEMRTAASPQPTPTAARGAPTLLFTENETNNERLYGSSNTTPYVKDGIDRAVVGGDGGAVNPRREGTKAAAHYATRVGPGESAVVELRLTEGENAAPFAGFGALFEERRREADEFYEALQPGHAGEDLKSVQRQALAGMLWSKQFFHYVVEQWLKGDPGHPPPPAERKHGRNREWAHLYNERVMSMPDKWEYPWYAAWDLAFHCIPLAMLDPEFAKSQLDLILREWYQHPNGQIPAYEWAFSDVNPPVMAWAAWRVYKMEEKHYGKADRMFLERVFHKLMLNFTWWVNRKDSEGNNIFQGGFLGLDNIGVFDRSAPLPTGGRIEQSDGTSWMGMFCLNIMRIALELALTNPVYEDIATKFFEHFLLIAEAMNNLGGEGIPLWNDEDEFFYDVLHLQHGQTIPLKVRSFVGLIPLFAVETLEPKLLDALPGFKFRLEWIMNNRPDLARLVSRWQEPGEGERRLLALVRGSRMKRLLRRALDPDEFLSDYGVRALSKFHGDHPYALDVDGATYTVHYDPAESRSGLFGGNSNWRGPIWFPVNYLMIESLQKLHHYYGDDFRVECPTGSGQLLTLSEVADFLSRRLIRIFTRDEHGRRAVFGGQETFQRDPHWRDYVPFYEYFHGDSGAGIGASHQTGWTGLVAKLIQQQGGRYDE